MLSEERATIGVRDERYAAHCDGREECAALFFSGLGSQDWKGMTVDS